MLEYQIDICIASKEKRNDSVLTIKDSTARRSQAFSMFIILGSYWEKVLNIDIQLYVEDYDQVVDLNEHNLQVFSWHSVYPAAKPFFPGPQIVGEIYVIQCTVFETGSNDSI
ncbi:MAG: hypothetical protein ACLTEE_16210 [Anaerobutyricum hallii]